MSRSYSSVLRSMPMCQAQLNSTDFRSFAPAAGVYAAPRRRGRDVTTPVRGACGDLGAGFRAFELER